MYAKISEDGVILDIYNFIYLNIYRRTIYFIVDIRNYSNFDENRYIPKALYKFSVYIILVAHIKKI